MNHLSHSAGLWSQVTIFNFIKNPHLPRATLKVNNYEASPETCYEKYHEKKNINNNNYEATTQPGRNEKKNKELSPILTLITEANKDENCFILFC